MQKTKAFFKAFQPKSIRFQILIFVLLIGVLFGVLFAVNQYRKTNTGRLGQLSNELHKVTCNLHEIKRLERDFRLFETMQPTFFKSGNSIYIKQLNANAKDIERQLNSFKQLSNKRQDEINTQIYIFERHLNSYHQNLRKLVALTRKLGFKDYGTIGKMREHIHAVENSPYPYNFSQMLMLRRHEKDFLLRKQEQYVKKHQQTTADLINSIETKSYKPKKKEQLLAHLKAYKAGFNKLVTLHKKIGYTPYSGLQGDMNEEYTRMKLRISRIQNLIQSYIKETEKKATNFFLLSLIISVFLIILLVILFLQNIGHPLIKLESFLRKAKSLHYKPTNKVPAQKRQHEIGKVAGYIKDMLGIIENQQQQYIALQRENNRIKQQNANLSSIGAAIMEQKNLDGLINQCYKSLNNIMEVPYLSIGVYSRKHMGLFFYGKEPGNKEIKRGFETLKEDNYLSIYTFKRKKVFFSNHVERDYAQYIGRLLHHNEAASPKSIIFLPMQTNNKTMGVFTVQHTMAEKYTENDLYILKDLINYISLALEKIPPQ